jgi:hypothetical protein
MPDRNAWRSNVGKYPADHPIQRILDRGAEIREQDILQRILAHAERTYLHRKADDELREVIVAALAEVRESERQKTQAIVEAAVDKFKASQQVIQALRTQDYTQRDHWKEKRQDAGTRLYEATDAYLKQQHTPPANTGSGEGE